MDCLEDSQFWNYEIKNKWLCNKIKAQVAFSDTETFCNLAPDFAFQNPILPIYQPTELSLVPQMAPYLPYSSPISRAAFTCQVLLSPLLLKPCHHLLTLHSLEWFTFSSKFLELSLFISHHLLIYWFLITFVPLTKVRVKVT